MNNNDMSKELLKFIESNIDLIDQNTKESWEDIYDKLATTDFIGEFTQTILEAGIDDPASIIGYIPAYYLYFSEIEHYEIPDSVTSIDDYAFYECRKLTNMVIPDSVTSIGYNAFRYCKSLTNMVIPDRITSIDEWSFANCDSLTSVKIPASVTSIGDKAFLFCTNLKEIHFKGIKRKWNNIVKGSDWRKNSSIQKIICTDGVIEL